MYYIEQPNKQWTANKQKQNAIMLKIKNLYSASSFIVVYKQIIYRQLFLLSGMRNDCCR